MQITITKNIYVTEKWGRGKQIWEYKRIYKIW